MLTPEEIQSREFLVSLRGYDRDEVHAFLDEVAEAFAQLLAEEGPAGGTVAAVEPPAPQPARVAPEPEAPLSPFAAIGAETQRILEAAQEAGEQIRARAQSEATRAREEAIAGAEAEVAVLQERAAETQRQIDVLELRRAEVADRLRQARETADLGLSELLEDVAATDDALLAQAPAAGRTAPRRAAGPAEQPAGGPEQLSAAVGDPEDPADVGEGGVPADDVVPETDAPARER